jgi:AraC-like DNA-binding protein
MTKGKAGEETMDKKKLTLEVIERLRKEYPEAKCTLDYEKAWQLLVSVRLAAQCTDARVDQITPKLYEKFPSVAALAEEAGVSDVYFRREFKRCAGMPPREYIRLVRLENAKALLDTALYSVSETATRCGFDSISYFSAEFRRAYGVTPSEFGRAGR